MFSATAEYALRAVAYLATTGARVVNSVRIAAATQSPAEYTAKVLKDLVAAGIVTAHKGGNGGFRLAEPPEQISILRILNAVDPLKRIKVCPLGLLEHRVSLCPLHKCMDDTVGRAEDYLARHTIADMVRAPTGSAGALLPMIGSPSGRPARRVRKTN